MPALEIHADTRTIAFTPASGTPFDLRVPALFGALLHAELRGAYIVVTTAQGRVSFHAETPRRVTNSHWRDTHPLAGKIHWHSLRRALRELCLLPQLASRVQFVITHHRYKSGARSSSGSAGRIVVDDVPVCLCADDPPANGFQPAALGAALAEYLDLAPHAALASDNVLVASVALLDRRVSREQFRCVVKGRIAHPLWEIFYALRAAHEESP